MSLSNARDPSALSTTFGGLLRATGSGIQRFFSLSPTKAKSAWSNAAHSQTPPASKPQTRQTSCHHTARATKERRQVPRNSSPGYTSPGALGRGFLVAGDWGPALRVPNLREALGAHFALLRWNLGLLPPATARSDNPGTVAYLPAQPPPSSGEWGCRLATLLSALRSARDPGNPLRASPATPRRAAPSPAAAVFLSVLLLSAQAWAQRRSRAAQLRCG